MIKMIVTDLDGTILNHERKILPKTEEYLLELKSRGYILVIATGRNFASAKTHTNGAKFANYLISDGGACIYIPDTEEELVKNIIPKQKAEEILSYWNEDVEFLQMTTKEAYVKYTREDKQDFLSRIGEIAHITIKMKSNAETEELYEKLEHEFSDLNVLLMQDSFKEDKSIVLTLKGVSKYSAIQKLATSLGVENDEIIAFGDSYNDMDMLKGCGFGVAVKNALEEVKGVSTATTPKGFNDDGVVDFLQSILDEE